MFLCSIITFSHDTGSRLNPDNHQETTIINIPNDYEVVKPVSPVHISIQDGNEVALLFEVENVDTYMHLLDTEGPGAMANDGVIKETVKIFVMDKEFHL
ncbi:hypothetical protein [Algoriphagus aquimarinus]|uniref:Uncharacterized protein n=1 Tax=Algoriphagus aquimarinus TaxID=237018 RepID=A0A5C7AZX1_9BACT|nr:hypothetical protein [Algoriphagus aquimarinus]TXE13727.1 hypothetical protein ESV85_07100 [Algoriphagus aquimarinus]